MLSPIWMKMRKNKKCKIDNELYGKREVGVVLEKNSCRTAKIIEFERLDVLPVNENGTLQWVVHSCDELENGALS